VRGEGGVRTRPGDRLVGVTAGCVRGGCGRARRLGLAASCARIACGAVCWDMSRTGRLAWSLRPHPQGALPPSPLRRSKPRFRAARGWPPWWRVWRACAAASARANGRRGTRAPKREAGHATRGRRRGAPEGERMQGGVGGSGGQWCVGIGCLRAGASPCVWECDGASEAHGRADLAPASRAPAPHPPRRHPPPPTAQDARRRRLSGFGLGPRRFCFGPRRWRVAGFGPTEHRSRRWA
jgi:hypothetical protein